MSLYYVLVFGIIALFSATVIWALWWALRGGQFSDFAKGAHSIFDDEEPPGRITDVFPDRKEELARQVRDG
ncbi:MAG: cbb3-type cytochrome oxidase assembly protein [Planctomycetota bacterium]